MNEVRQHTYRDLAAMKELVLEEQRALSLARAAANRR